MRLGGGNVALHRTLPFLVLSSNKLTLLSTPLKDPTLREGGAWKESAAVNREPMF
jgi:hypothetical protein